MPIILSLLSSPLLCFLSFHVSSLGPLSFYTYSFSLVTRFTFVSSPLLPSHLHIRGDITQSEVRMNKGEVVPLPLALALKSNDTGLSGPKAHSCYAWIPRSRACIKQNRTCRKAS